MSLSDTMKAILCRNNALANDLLVRLAGIFLLVVAAGCAWWVHRAVQLRPPSAATVLDLAACAGTFFGLSGGATLTVLGRSLFEQVPLPPRPFVAPSHKERTND